LAWLALVGGVVACQTASERADLSATERGEALRLSRAIDQLRDADNARKHEFLTRLQQEPCTTWCALKRVCEGAYREHVAALEAIAEVRALGTAIPTRPGADAEVLAARKLDEAERRLETSRELSSQCVDVQGDLKLRLKL
jgi:hypothetical protein